MDKAAKVGKSLAATTLKIGVKAATLGVLGGEDIDKVGEAIADGVGEITEISVKKVLEEYADKDAQFQAMRSALEDLTDFLRVDSNKN